MEERTERGYYSNEGESNPMEPEIEHEMEVTLRSLGSP